VVGRGRKEREADRRKGRDGVGGTGEVGGGEKVELELKKKLEWLSNHTRVLGV